MEYKRPRQASLTFDLSLYNEHPFSPLPHTFCFSLPHRPSLLVRNYESMQVHIQQRLFYQSNRGKKTRLSKKRLVISVNMQ